MLNIVVPMAGRGSRFQTEGYDLPKPLIPVKGLPMIRLVINNLRPNQPHRFIFLCLEEHISRYSVDRKLSDWAPSSLVVPVDRVTEGAACTVLLAKHLINSNDAMMIANSDQWVDMSIDRYLSRMDESGSDGLIMTMKANDPKWSYLRLNNAGEVTEVVEKQVVSDEATVGIYNFRKGSDFVWAAEKMISENLRVNGEFYVAPAYNQLIQAGKRLAYFNIGAEFQGMYGIGIPSDLRKFEAHPVSEKAISL
jgi:NDP-sugar pyrophosphorylase family protein